MFQFDWLLESGAKPLNETVVKLQFALIVAVAVFMLAHTVLLALTRTAHFLGIKEGAMDMGRSVRHTRSKQMLATPLGTEAFLSDSSYGPSNDETTWTSTDSDLHPKSDEVSSTGQSKSSYTDADLQKVAHGLKNY